MPVAELKAKQLSGGVMALACLVGWKTKVRLDKPAMVAIVSIDMVMIRFDKYLV